MCGNVHPRSSAGAHRCRSRHGRARCRKALSSSSKPSPCWSVTRSVSADRAQWHAQARQFMFCSRRPRRAERALCRIWKRSLSALGPFGMRVALKRLELPALTVSAARSSGSTIQHERRSGIRGEARCPAREQHRAEPTLSCHRISASARQGTRGGRALRTRDGQSHELAADLVIDASSRAHSHWIFWTGSACEAKGRKSHRPALCDRDVRDTVSGAHRLARRVLHRPAAQSGRGGLLVP